MNQNECVRCGAIGTNLGTNFCLICIGERERERRRSDIISSKEAQYTNLELMNDYLSTLK